jgi:serine/threonine protein kinase/Flp pilus assembly protein TadD
MREETIFIEALDKEDPAERAAFLDQACAGDPALRERIEKLLLRHEETGGPLDAAPPTVDDPLRAGPGTVIGPYKLIQEIGEGGMGTVWMAQQTAPIKRLVALKVIKPGMDSKQVLARFEAERQALALMDHPSIARVLDAGTAPGGRPFFVMELVKGVPLTRYCDEHRLTPKQRLELFIPVCQAIQHAHQKGVIHRDIKPSNVLVALYDGKPVPKVIDFGIAKATGQQLTEHTLVTGFGAVVGTLEYMSPEQAELNQLDIDTRSDIYSLGVLLYELLTGSTPLERKRLKEAALLEMLRVIREEEPPRPSMRLSTTEELPSVAANRGLEPKKLSSLVRGELDWIVMKALEKDRNRRYETANALASDVQRYLADEAVHACPPSAWYRLRKLARRNKVPLLTAAVIAVTLVSGTVVSAWQALRATEANRRMQDNLELSLGALDEIYLSVLESLLPRELEAEPENQDLLIKALGFYEKFAQRNQADPNIWREVAKAYNRAGDLHTRLGHYDQALVALDREGEVITRLIVDSPADSELTFSLAKMHGLKGNAYQLQRELVNEGSHQARAAQIEFQKGIDLLEPLVKKSAVEAKYRETLANLHNDLGMCLRDDDDSEKAELHYRQAIEVRGPMVKEADDLASKLFYMQQSAMTHINLGVLLNLTGRLDEAEKVNRQALDLISEVNTRAVALRGYKRGRLPGFANARHVPGDLAHAHYTLGNTLRFKGQSSAAEKEFRQAVDFQAQAVEDWPRHMRDRTFLAYFRCYYGTLLFEGGKRPEAFQQFRQSIGLYRQLQKESKRELANSEKFIDCLWFMGDLLFAEGDREAASPYYREARDLLEKEEKQNAHFGSELAWFLLACPDPAFRDPARALELAKKSVARSEGKDGNLWNTLGVAQYRLGDWQAALDSLEKANRLRGERQAEDWFFLTMAQWQIGQKEVAQASYNRAVKLLSVYEYPPVELSRWRAEAAELLGLKEPKK